jgi:hypothetical protein
MRFVIGLIITVAVAGFDTGASAQAQGPCFYMQPNFQGQPMCIAQAQRVPALGAANDRIMSVQIPRGVRVTICEHANFQGACVTLDQSVPNIAALAGGRGISSVASEPAGAGGPPRGPQQGTQQGTQQPRGPQQGMQQPPGPPPGPSRGPGFTGPQQLPGPPQQGQQVDYNDARETRRVMHALRRECEGGDTRACVQFGIIIGENRERRSQWRQESPDLFWWER